MKNFKPFILSLCFANTGIAAEQSLSLQGTDNGLSNQNFEFHRLSKVKEIFPENRNSLDKLEEKLINTRLTGDYLANVKKFIKITDDFYKTIDQPDDKRNFRKFKDFLSKLNNSIFHLSRDDLILIVMKKLK